MLSRASCLRVISSTGRADKKFGEWCATSTASAAADGEYCGENDAHLSRMDMYYHEAFGGKYMSRAVLFGLEPGVIGFLALSLRSAISSARETS
jgi:hypothetical protein